MLYQKVSSIPDIRRHCLIKPLQLHTIKLSVKLAGLFKLIVMWIAADGPVADLALHLIRNVIKPLHKHQLTDFVDLQNA